MANTADPVLIQVRPATPGNGPNGENCEVVDVSEIRDLLEYHPPRPFSTSAILNYCQRKMILPYTRLLGLLGLRPLLGDFTEQNLALNAINKIHLFIVTLFLIFGYVMQFLTCYRRDQGFSYVTNSGREHSSNHPSSTFANSTTVVECDGSLFLCYILPSLLHFCSFVQTIYLFRVTENEHLQTLFEKVFLLTSRSRGALTQRNLLRKLRAHMILTVIWLIWSLVTQLFLVLATTFKVVSFMPKMSEVVKQSLMGVMIASTFCQDVVHCLVICNYCIECQLLMSFIECIKERVIEKSLALEVAMKEMLEYEKFLQYLNKDVAPAIGLFLLVSSMRTLVDLSIIVRPGFLYDTIDTRSFSIIMLLIQWAAISVAPLISAAYVTASSRSLRSLGQTIRIRPFGFQDTPPQHLDSFMIFTASQRGLAKLCFVPISAAFLGAVATLSALLFLVNAHLLSSPF